MRRLRSWLKPALIIVIVLGALVFTFGSRTQQAISVAALQDAVPRSALSFGHGWSPKLPPPWLDARATEAIEWYFSDARGYTLADRERHTERFQSLFWSPIETIDIKPITSLHGDAGSPLAWFPRLLRMKVLDHKQNLTELDWIRICHGLGRSDSVQEITLAGEALTDFAISHLTGQPSLQVIAVSHSVVTSECAATFASLPRLKTLILGAPKRRHGRNGFTFKEKDEIAARLPSVELVFPQAYYAMP
jgi:hypothetical protein